MQYQDDPFAATPNMQTLMQGMGGPQYPGQMAGGGGFVPQQQMPAFLTRQPGGMTAGSVPGVAGNMNMDQLTQILMMLQQMRGGGGQNAMATPGGQKRERFTLDNNTLTAISKMFAGGGAG